MVLCGHPENTSKSSKNANESPKTPVSPQKKHQRVPVGAAGRAGARPLPAVGCQELPPQLLFAVKRLLGAAGGGTKHKPTPRPAGSCLGSRSGGCRLPRACQNLQLRAPRCGVCASGGREGEARWHDGVLGVKATTVTTETRMGGAAQGGPGGEAGAESP